MKIVKIYIHACMLFYCLYNNIHVTDNVNNPTFRLTPRHYVYCQKSDRQNRIILCVWLDNRKHSLSEKNVKNSCGIGTTPKNDQTRTIIIFHAL